ncbi:MAG: site-2 protease family protein [Acidimicrobiia bacterium]|nr:site-2 protease family protein [Acidimicrobiia bacterium]
MRGGIRLGRVFGIPITAGYSWLIIVILIASALRLNFETQGAGSTTALVAGIAGSLAFFLSVVIHELSHSVVAVRRGIPVRQIRLFIFGGVSELEHEALRPSDELAVTIAGPLSSFALAGLFLGTGWFAQGGATGLVLGWLGTVNLLLAGFNLLPGFPLDGGRVLRSILWKRMGDRTRATRIAARVGQGMAVVMVAGGLVASMWIGFDGIWLAMIGWFLFTAAGMADGQRSSDPRLAGLRARRVMRPIVTYVSPALPLAELTQPVSELTPVASPWGKPVGLLERSAVEKVDESERPWTRVGDVMRRLRPGEVIEASMTMDSAMRGVPGGSFKIVVTENGEPIGVITPEILEAYASVLR